MKNNLERIEKMMDFLGVEVAYLEDGEYRRVGNKFRQYIRGLPEEKDVVDRDLIYYIDRQLVRKCLEKMQRDSFEKNVGIPLHE